jgi:hypothetical protein
MWPVQFRQDLWMQGAYFSNGFALDDHVELLSPEVVVLGGGLELIVRAETQMALLEDELQVAVSLSEQTGVRVLLHFVGEHCSQFLYIFRSYIRGGVD